MPTTSKRDAVVIYRLGSLGDTVVALPCLHKIEQSFPDRERIALTNFPINSKASALGTILGDSKLIHRSVAYPVGLRSLKGFVALRRELVALQSDTLIYLTPPRGLMAARRDAVFFRLCGFRHIIGLPLTEDLQHNRVGADGLMESEYSRLARCIAALGPLDLMAPASWDLRLSALECDLADELIAPLRDRPYFAINMGGKEIRNDWGIDNWLEFIGQISHRVPDHGLLILGGAEDQPRALLVAERWRGAVVDGCGRTSPRVSGAAARRAELFVGHDSGPMHLSACVGVRCVGLFGNNNPPGKWFPAGHGHRAIYRAEGVRAITVDDVSDAVDWVRRTDRQGQPRPAALLSPA